MGTAIIAAINDGLGIVGDLATALNSAFTSLFMTGSNLSNVGTFAFILMGLGIGVGVIKLVFHWITGRHGM
jgi:predicted Kef-type K+ transport protein